MHKRGREINVKQIRNGKEVMPLPAMKYVPANTERIYPGDRLITNCKFDTTHDKKEVLGGIFSPLLIL
jgi:Copper type II ascorbate-dependent monooxygenase, C-terminal domain